jgi:Kef-type K+ transport system membrane component KefB
VALDDAGCVILFSVVFAFMGNLLGGVGGAASGLMGVFHAVLEVTFSILIGIVGGTLLHKMTKSKTGTNEILIISLSVIFITTAFSIVFHLSPLLTNMAAGSTLVNLSARNHRLFRILEPITPPLYALFFVIAGTELKLDVILRGDILLLGSVYILARGIGKYGGVWAGCALSGIGKPIRGNLGWCMLPQAGVAIGLVLLIQASPLMQGLPADQQALIHNMVNIVLLSVFVNELVGPPLSKMAIIRGNQMEDAQ